MASFLLKFIKLTFFSKKSEGTATQPLANFGIRSLSASRLKYDF